MASPFMKRFLLALIVAACTAGAAQSSDDGITTQRAYIEMDGDTMRYVQCQGLCVAEAGQGVMPKRSQILPPAEHMPLCLQQVERTETATIHMFSMESSQRVA